MSTGCQKSWCAQPLTWVDHKDAAVQTVAKRACLENNRCQQASVDTTRVDWNKFGSTLVVSDWRALCQAWNDGVEQEDWESMWNTLREAAKVGIKKVGEHTSLLWKLSENKGG